MEKVVKVMTLLCQVFPGADVPLVVACVASLVGPASSANHEGTFDEDGEKSPLIF